MTFKTRNSCNILDTFEREKLVKICAPMVRYSKLQFRTLVREYGCDICFTPMILADSFCLSQKARDNEFTTNELDSPVIVQFAANNAKDFVGAACLVSPYCDGVDLNCGCPQRWAKQIGIGCIMMENPNLIADLVKQCRNQIPKPFSVSVKMRLSSDVRKTVEVCKQLEHCGATFLNVHARTPNQSTGPINEEVLKLVKENVQCPVVANGGMKTLQDALDLQSSTNCDGVMVANGLLTNPTLFSGTNMTTTECIQRWVDIYYNSSLTKEEFMIGIGNSSISVKKATSKLTFQCFHHHLVFMLEKLLSKSLKRIFNNLQTFDDVLEFLLTHFNIKPRLFSKDEFNANKAAELNYENRDSVYLNYGLDNKSINTSQYEDDSSDCENPGKYFLSKLEGTKETDCDLSDLFLM